MNNLDLNKGVQLSIIVAVLLISFSIFYQFVIKDRIKSAEQKADKIMDKIKRDTCLSSCDTDYMNNWNYNCKEFGLDKKEDGCTLPTYIAKDITENCRKCKEECLKVHPIK